MKKLNTYPHFLEPSEKHLLPEDYLFIWKSQHSNLNKQQQILTNLSLSECTYLFRINLNNILLKLVEIDFNTKLNII